jgi:pimeloyl-ACP methyl ester carboxylesterase
MHSVKEDLDEYAHHLASRDGLRGALGVYRAIAAEASDLVQLTNRKMTMPVWAVGVRSFDGHGALRTVERLAESVKRGVIDDCGHWIIEEQPTRLLETSNNFS